MRILLTGVVISGICLFHFMTLREGHNWGDDFAMYVQGARNIAEGKAYSATTVEYNAMNPMYAPHSYPPAFSFCLAAGVKLFGGDLFHLKYMQILFLFLALIAIAFYFRDKLNFVSLLAFLLFFGMSPLIALHKESILSDLPLLLPLFLAFVFLESLNPTTKIYRVLITGILLYLVFAFRSIAFILWPAALLSYLWRFRKADRNFLILFFSSLTPMLVQSMLVPSSNDYWQAAKTEYAGFSVGQVLQSTIERTSAYIQSCSEIWGLPSGSSIPLSVVLIVLWVLLLILLLQRCFRNKDAVSVFLLGYFVFVCGFPAFQGVRYLLLFVPFLLATPFYLAQNASLKKFSALLVLAVLLLSAKPYIHYYKMLPAHDTPWGVEEPEALALYDYMNTQIPSGEKIVAGKPRAISLYVQRPLIVYPRPMDEAKILNWLRGNHVKYAISGFYDKTYVFDLIAHHPEVFKQVFSNSHYSLWQLSYP